MKQDITTRTNSKKPILAIDAKEGELTKKIESVTAQIPSMGYLALAIGSMVASAGLAIFSERKNIANFVGLWVPTFLLFGIYNKIVKVEGSDQSGQLH